MSTTSAQATVDKARRVMARAPLTGWRGAYDRLLLRLNMYTVIRDAEGAPRDAEEQALRDLDSAMRLWTRDDFDT